jgi:hypothetical protein
MPISPNSLITTAVSAPSGVRSNSRIKVVLPEPRNPVTTVTEMRAPRARRCRRPNGPAPPRANNALSRILHRRVRKGFPINAENIMTAHPLSGALERMLRANEHLSDLKQRLSPFLQGADHGPFVSAVCELHKIKLDSTVVMPASMRIPILVGETCYNLRGALDYLVFELTKLDSGEPSYHTQFPIESKPQQFCKHLKGKKGCLRGLSDAHVARVKALQPCCGCVWTKTLQRISNPDKHREFVALGGNVILTIFVAGEDLEFDQLPIPIHRGPHPRTRAEVDMKICMAGTLLFTDRTPVIETLEELVLKVKETLAAFWSDFAMQPAP